MTAGTARRRLGSGVDFHAALTVADRLDSPDGVTESRVCRLPLHQLAVDAGWTTHPLCGPPEDFRALVEAAATSTQETP